MQGDRVCPLFINHIGKPLSLVLVSEWDSGNYVLQLLTE